jgi:hypothetical protein
MPISITSDYRYQAITHFDTEQNLLTTDLELTSRKLDSLWDQIKFFISYLLGDYDKVTVAEKIKDFVSERSFDIATLPIEEKAVFYAQLDKIENKLIKNRLEAKDSLDKLNALLIKTSLDIHVTYDLEDMIAENQEAIAALSEEDRQIFDTEFQKANTLLKNDRSQEILTFFHTLQRLLYSKDLDYPNDTSRFATGMSAPLLRIGPYDDGDKIVNDEILIGGASYPSKEQLFKAYSTIRSRDITDGFTMPETTTETTLPASNSNVQSDLPQSIDITDFDEDR